MQNQVNDQTIEEMEQETIHAIFKGEKQKVIVLYRMVEQIWTKGNTYTRTLIANQFILPLSQQLEMHYSRGKEYLNLFPKQLKLEYIRQIHGLGV